MRIRDITISDLPDFIGSAEFRLLEHIPISPQRAISHFNNPRAAGDDKVLFLAYDEDRFIGFLGALPDNFFISGRQYKLAWLSCMWVDIAWRRQGIAYKLLEHAHKAWNSNLLISNFIPRSKAAFDKTGLFVHFKDLPGVRGYLRFDLSTILVAKKPFLQKISWLLTFTDGVLNLFNEVRLLCRRNSISKLQYRYFSSMDDEAEEFLIKHNAYHLTLKNRNDYNWISAYPWIIKAPHPDLDAMRYAFSSTDKHFRQYFLMLYDQQHSPMAFLMLTIRGKHLKTPFVFMEKDREKEILRFLYSFMIRERISTFTTCHPALSTGIRRFRHPFIHTRSLHMESVITATLKSLLGDTAAYYLQDGDGDAAFT